MVRSVRRWLHTLYGNEILILCSRSHHPRKDIHECSPHSLDLYVPIGKRADLGGTLYRPLTGHFEGLHLLVEYAQMRHRCIHSAGLSGSGSHSMSPSNFPTSWRYNCRFVMMVFRILSPR
jgi:hypothetical protein